MVATATSPELAPRSRRWARVVAALGLLAAAGLTIFGFFWTRSWDLPWGGDQRFGLYRQGFPTVWICSDGHHHYSIPFWMGALAVLLLTAIFWRVFGRPRKRSA